MVQKILGAQRDFSYGEVDPALKRADDHPARKAGLRQMANARILNSGGVQNRSGRRALYPITNNGKRTERFTISAGNVFDIQFAAGRLKVIDNTGTVVGNFTLQGNGAALPWASSADISSINYAIFNLSIYICFGHSMRPQVVSWDGVSTWSIADYTELVFNFQKRTPFYRIAPQGITLQPLAASGSVNLSTSAPYFTASMVGMRIRYLDRQILITSFSSSVLAIGTVQEILPSSQTVTFATNASTAFSVGDVVIGALSGARGIVTSTVTTSLGIQLMPKNTAVIVNNPIGSTDSSSVTTNAFSSGETIVGPGGAITNTAVSVLQNPAAISAWDEEVMNDFRGYPASCFADQFRLGFCDFPSVPGGIAWSSINAPTDLYVGVNPNNAMFELAPGKVRVYYVVPGPESSEFVFCDRRIYYIPISPTNPLKPGSVAFQILTGDGSAQVHPQIAQEALLYVNAGQNTMMAVIATGAYLRPFNTKNLSDFHAHLFNNIQCIAAPSADGTFNERYAYVLNGDGSIAVGKYDPQSLQGNQPVIGWGPWSGAGVVSWIAAYAADVVFTSTYFSNGVVEVLDDTQYLDCAVSVNSLPAAFTPPGGKGPLWFIAPGQTVTLIDQVTRMMGTYVVDANGFIVAQFNGGENLNIASLVAGQPWTMTTEPFCPDASPGTDVGQRMFKRRVSRFAVYVINSTGFLMARLFSGPITRTSPALGTIMNQRRVTAWNQDDDATKPPPLREEAQRWRPIGRAFDPRVAIIKDTPGPLLISEIGIEATI